MLKVIIMVKFMVDIMRLMVSGWLMVKIVVNDSGS